MVHENFHRTRTSILIKILSIQLTLFGSFVKLLPRKVTPKLSLNRNFNCNQNPRNSAKCFSFFEQKTKSITPKLSLILNINCNKKLLVIELNMFHFRKTSQKLRKKMSKINTKNNDGKGIKGVPWEYGKDPNLISDAS